MKQKGNRFKGLKKKNITLHHYLKQTKILEREGNYFNWNLSKWTSQLEWYLIGLLIVSLERLETGPGLLLLPPPPFYIKILYSKVGWEWHKQWSKENTSNVFTKQKHYIYAENSKNGSKSLCLLRTWHSDLKKSVVFQNILRKF